MRRPVSGYDNSTSLDSMKGYAFDGVEGGVQEIDYAKVNILMFNCNFFNVKLTSFRKFIMALNLLDNL